MTGWSRWLAGLVVIVLLPAALLVAGQWPQEERLIAADPDDILADRSLRATAIALGQPLFRDRCAACHGVDGRGSKSRSVPDLTDGDWLYGEGRVSEVEQIVLHGIRSGDPRGWNLADMPAYATPTPYPREPIAPLSPTDVADVAAWLRALHGSAPDAAAAERGKAIFDGRGGCWDCHGSDASGDTAIGAPNLLDDVWLYGDGSPASIAQSIAYGRRGTMPAFARHLTPAQARAVAAYAASLSHRSQDESNHARP